MNEMRTVSNITEEEFDKLMAERTAEREKQAKCPVCGARREREGRMRHFEMDLLNYLRENRTIKRESCVLCVQKHVGRAKAYHKELMTAKNSGKTDGEAAVNIILNFLDVLGHLGCAIEECDEYPELQETITAQERQFRYEGVEPDWRAIAVEILAVEKNK